MPWETGTAAGHIDLMAKLKTFLTTNAALVAAGQQWEVFYDDLMANQETYSGRFAFGASTGALIPDPLPLNLPSKDVMYLYRGEVNIVTPGNYGFAIDTNSWAEVLVDGVVVATRLTTGFTSGTWGTEQQLALTAGLKNIEIRLMVKGNTQLAIAVGWRPPGAGSITHIPAASLSNGKHYWDTALASGQSSHADFERNFTTRTMRFKGKGLSGDKEIYFNIGAFSDNATDTDGWSLTYGVGVDEKQRLVGASVNPKAMPLWQSTIKYWFIANGQRFIVIAKVSTEYTACYCGFFLPYALPDEYQYPLALGAPASQFVRFSNITALDYRSFWHPGSRTSSGTFLAHTSLAVRNQVGTEIPFNNDNEPAGMTYPYRSKMQFKPAKVGEYALMPIILFKDAEAFGEFDGVFHVTGFGASPEDIVTIGGVDHLLVHSARERGIEGFAAFRLE